MQASLDRALACAYIRYWIRSPSHWSSHMHAWIRLPLESPSPALHLVKAHRQEAGGTWRCIFATEIIMMAAELGLNAPATTSSSHRRLLVHILWVVVVICAQRTEDEHGPFVKICSPGWPGHHMKGRQWTDHSTSGGCRIRCISPTINWWMRLLLLVLDQSAVLCLVVLLLLWYPLVMAHWTDGPRKFQWGWGGGWGGEYSLQVTIRNASTS